MWWKVCTLVRVYHLKTCNLLCLVCVKLIFYVASIYIFPRRGIGWHLLKASEELISKMSASKTVYLHCRMIDAGPYNMYTKAGYSIVKTDSILILLTLQRRKHLMCKYLKDVESPSEVETPVDQLTLWIFMWKQKQAMGGKFFITFYHIMAYQYCCGNSYSLWNF